MYLFVMLEFWLRPLGLMCWELILRKKNWKLVVIAKYNKNVFSKLLRYRLCYTLILWEQRTINRSYILVLLRRLV